MKRREFIEKSLSLTGSALLSRSFEFWKYTPLLSFSTLGCPDWTFENIINFAASNNYDGIELRGLQRQLDLTKCPEFSDEKINETLKLVAQKNLKISDLGSSAEMHHTDEVEKKKNLNEAIAFIDLAKKLNCPFTRVFPNKLPKDRDKAETLQVIANNLRELGKYGADKGVKVLMETHGDLVYTDDIENVMSMAGHPNIGLVWDVVNMWSITREPPVQVYSKLKKYIYHTHIKDLKVEQGKEKYVLLGTGETPIFEAVSILAKNNYSGYYSFEWEKLWHPEIEAPEIAIADYPKKMRQFFTNMKL